MDWGSWRRATPPRLINRREIVRRREPLPQYSVAGSLEAESVNASMETVALKPLQVDDDPTLNP